MRMSLRCLLTIFFSLAFLSSVAIGQSPSRNTKANLATYDLAREVSLIGTVQAYIPAGQTPPCGAHVTLQTAAGIVDVHLGNARLLAANHFEIQNGDTLRIIGEDLAYGNGTQFVARIVQKGTQALAVRSVRGIPLSYMAPCHGTQSKKQGGVL